MTPIPDLLNFATGLIGAFGYAGLGAVLIVAAPELILPFAGFMVAQGELNFLGVLGASLVGALIGQLAIYWAARVYGEARVRTFFRRHGRSFLTSERDFERALQLFGRYQTLAISLGRAVPTVRSLISIPAGLKPVSLRRFVVLTLSGTALWNTLLLSAGALVGRNWERLVEGLEAYGTVVLVLLGLGLGILIVRRLRARAVRWQRR